MTNICALLRNCFIVFTVHCRLCRPNTPMRVQNRRQHRVEWLCRSRDPGSFPLSCKSSRDPGIPGFRLRCRLPLRKNPGIPGSMSGSREICLFPGIPGIFPLLMLIIPGSRDIPGTTLVSCKIDTFRLSRTATISDGKISRLAVTIRS